LRAKLSLQIMVKKISIELLRWSLRFHSIFHLIHIYIDYEDGQWVGLILSVYMVFVEFLASFLIPKDHVHFGALTSEVHEDCNKSS